jgi:ubiquinone/menaquinone biosynthesis C-methylase UbiE
MGKALFDEIARFYDEAVKGLRLVENDVAFYHEHARTCGGEVLELACGTGRVLIPLAEQGVSITGIDASSNMLEQARRKLKRLPREVQQRVDLQQQDMCTFELDSTYSLIFCTFRSFQHLLTKKAQGACLEQVRKHLQDNGMFIIDLFVPFHHLLAQQKRSLYLGTFVDPGTGSVVSRRSEVKYDLAAQTLHEDRFYEWTDKEGGVHRLIWSFDLAYLFRYEVELLLEKHGFAIEHVYGDFKRSPYDYYSGEQIYVVRKINR